MGVKRKALRVKTKIGVDPNLERSADKLLKADRTENKKRARLLRFRKGRDARKEALLTPSKTIVAVRDERLLKKMESEAKPKLRPLTSTTRKMVARRTQAALTARGKAKEEGKKAGISLAKARAAAKKKAPYTLEAKEKTRLIGVERKIARANSGGRGGYTQDTINAAKIGARRLIEDGSVTRKSRHMRNTAINLLDSGDLPHLSGFKIPKERSALAVRRMTEFENQSRVAARKSGGYSTARKRNAESGIAHIASGKAYKRVARLGGALSLVSMFMNHINTKEKKNG